MNFSTILKMLNEHAKLGLALFMMMALMLTACPTNNEPTSTPTTTSSTVDPAKLSVEANLDFGKTETEKSFSVKNTGGETLSWTSQSEQDWLTLTPASGEVEANQTVAVKVSVNRERLAAGANATKLQLRAQKDGSDVEGSPVSVEVKAFKVMPPTVLFEGKDLTNIQADGATMAGEVKVLGSSPVTQHGHVWSETKGVDLDKAGDSKTELGELKAVGTFNSNLTGLTAGKTYYVKAYATNAEGTGYSAELTFNTSQMPPALTFVSADITAIAQTTATASATLTGLGSVPIIQRGHVWSLTPNPTLTTASVGKTELGTASATGKFSSSLTGLTAERTYYVRAYAYTATDTVYTNLLTLATLGDLNLSSTSIGENSAVGTAVGILSTAGGSGFSYALVVGDGSGDNGSFEVGGNLLKTKTVLDFETKTSYKIRVQSAKGAQTFERAFVITVTNVNEKPTALALTQTSIAENSATGTQIGTFSTTDPDAGDSHTYELAAGAADNGSFQISGNVLQTKAGLDYETDSVYNIKVSTKDAGNLVLNQDFVIKVTNVNEAPTTIALTNLTIAENSATGTQVGTFSTTDVDAGDSHTYELVSGGADNASFEIEGNALKTKAVFDYETDSVYNIKVSAKDAGNLSLAQDFMIKVSNVVVAATNILLSTDSIRENNAVGDSVGRLSSAPAESDGVYSLVGGGGDTDNGKFTLAGDTLKAGAVFDFETKTTYNIRVRTTNSAGSFEKAFTIRVTDVNEAPSAPTLTSPTNAATDIALNTKLVWQASTDPDGNPLTYDVYLGTTSPPTTKVVAAKKVLEYTPSGQSISTKYYWKVVANDGSNQTETAVWNYTTAAVETYAALVEKISKNISFQWQGDSVILQSQQFNGNSFTIMGDFSTNLDELVDDKKIQIGYGLESQTEKKVSYTKAMVMNFPLDNFSDLVSAYNQPFFNPTVKVNFYIDDRKIITEKFTFQTVAVKGNTTASLAFKQGNVAIPNYKVFNDDGAITLNISNDDFASYGLESRIETTATEITSRTDISTFTVATPDKNAVPQNMVQVVTLQSPKTIYLVGATLFIRPKDSKADWISYLSVTNEYYRFNLSQNPIDVSFPLGLIREEGEDVMFTFKNTFENANLGKMGISLYIPSVRALTRLFIYNADGSIQTNPGNFHLELITSMQILDDKGVENTQPFVKDKYYTIKFKGLKKSGFIDGGNSFDLEIIPTSGGIQEVTQVLFVR